MKTAGNVLSSFVGEGGRRRSIRITLAVELLADARALGIDVGKAAETGVAVAVAARRTALWLEENATALQSSNEYVQRKGLPLSRFALRPRRGPQSKDFDLAVRLAEEVNGRPILSPAKFIEFMNLDVTSFARSARVHVRDVNHDPATASVQTYIRDSVRVLQAAIELAECDLAEAKFWYRNEPLSPFDYKTAEALVADGRSDDVVRLLALYARGFARCLEQSRCPPLTSPS